MTPTKILATDSFFWFFVDYLKFFYVSKAVFIFSPVGYILRMPHDFITKISICRKVASNFINLEKVFRGAHTLEVEIKQLHIILTNELNNAEEVQERA